MSLKDIFYLELWQPLCLVEQNYLCNLGRRHHEEQFCEIILNLDQYVVQEMLFKDISYLELGGPFVQSSRTICAIFGEGIKRNNSVKFILNMDQWFRRCHLKDFLSGALVFRGAEPFMQFWYRAL